MDTKQVITLESGKEIVVKNVNNTQENFVLDYNEYGSIEIELVIGGSFTIKAGTVAPTITRKDPGDNAGITIVDN
jgi:hypothetical protein